MSEEKVKSSDSNETWNTIEFFERYKQNYDYCCEAVDEPSVFYMQTTGRSLEYTAGELFELFKNSRVDATFISDYSLGMTSKIYIVERKYEDPVDPEGARNDLLVKKSFKEIRFFDVSFIYDAIDSKYVTLSIKDEDLDSILIELDNIREKRNMPLTCPQDYIFCQVDIEKTTQTHKIPLKISIMAKGKDKIVNKWGDQDDPLDALVVVHHDNGRILYGSYLTDSDILDILSTMDSLNADRDTVIF